MCQIRFYSCRATVWVDSLPSGGDFSSSTARNFYQTRAPQTISDHLLSTRELVGKIMSFKTNTHLKMMIAIFSNAILLSAKIKNDIVLLRAREARLCLSLGKNHFTILIENPHWFWKLHSLHNGFSPLRCIYACKIKLVI